MMRSLGWALSAALVLSACGTSGETQTTVSSSEDAGSPVTSSTSAPGATTASSAPTTTEAAPTVEAPDLADTSWNVTDYRLPSGTITNVWKTEVTISFSADGTVSGSAGCNDYQGTWSVSGNWNEFEEGVPDPEDGQMLMLDSLSWTETACEDEAIMEQEAEILDLLLNSGRWVLIRGNFNLRDAEGSFLFEAEPA